MVRFSLALLTLTAGAPAQFLNPPAGEPEGAPKLQCSQLFALTGFEFTIESATAMPDFCRVMVNVVPEIRIEVALPTRWNRRFLMTGNGGYAGDSLDQPGRITQRTANMRRGFVAAVTNTGHDGRREPLASFATDRQKLLDYAFRSLHLTAEVGKRIATTYYGVKPTRSYYMGCSTGGRQGLMLAQRFPDDFDGIVAGAPVLNFSATMTSFACTAQALAAAPIPFAKLAALSERIYAQCDEKDGLKDGLIDDPRRCGFQPARDLPRCTAADDNAKCFTAAQIGALEKIYGDIQVNGTRYFPGWPVGAEVAGDDGKSGWDNWIIRENGQKTIAYGFAESFFRYMAYPGEGVDILALDVNKDVPRLEWIHNVLDATNPDLSGFRGRNGKLLMYFGWADQSLNAQMGVDYYEAATQKMGPNTTDFFRLFMQPGVFHCGGGPGAGSFDSLQVVIDWVEQGKAPDRITGSKIAGGKTLRTRPLCPYPQTAKYKGSGSIDEADNFRCVAP
jgi:feruloyl esterase